MKNSSLGKGLSTLLKEELLSVEKEDIVTLVDIDDIYPNTSQPRKVFEHDKLKELADSIKDVGLLQPIIVNFDKEVNKYQIIAGERRWRACRLAQINEVPVIIRRLKPQEILELALIENIQREELSVIEEAGAFAKLIHEFNYTHEQLAVAVSKSRSHVSNILRLNQLPQSIKDKVHTQKLTMGHVRCLVGHEHNEVIADYIVTNELSVRQTEDIVKNWDKKEYTKIPNAQRIPRLHDHKNTDLNVLTQSLSEKFGMKITIENHTIGGKLIFHYQDLEKLDNLLIKLC